ncbi:MAG TPA: hypothetical protein VHP33_03020 [Polyangiaceae bacterium]|nr:hypothetical protein [Polyangiaceae bacterium]
MRRFLGLLGLGAVACLGGSILGCGKRQAAVVCHVSYGGEEQRLVFPATHSPYAVKAVDVAGRFAFKAIYLQEPFQARSIHLYAYDRTGTEDRLIQEGKYAPPFAEPAGAGYGFTGRQLVYSREQRELEYWCEVAR